MARDTCEEIRELWQTKANSEVFNTIPPEVITEGYILSEMIPFNEKPIFNVGVRCDFQFTKF